MELRLFVQDHDGVAAGLAVVVAVDQAATGVGQTGGGRPEILSCTGFERRIAVFGVNVTESLDAE